MLDSLVKFIQDYKASNPTGLRKWLVGFVVVLAVILAFVILVVMQYSRAKQLTALQTQLDIANQGAAEASANAQVATSKVEQEQHQKAAEAALATAAAIQEQIQQVQDDHQRNLETINSIRSWSDVDAKVR